MSSARPRFRRRRIRPSSPTPSPETLPRHRGDSTGQPPPRGSPPQGEEGAALNSGLLFYHLSASLLQTPSIRLLHPAAFRPLEQGTPNSALYCAQKSSKKISIYGDLPKGKAQQSCSKVIKTHRAAKSPNPAVFDTIPFQHRRNTTRFGNLGVLPCCPYAPRFGEFIYLFVKCNRIIRRGFKTNLKKVLMHSLKLPSRN